tara:strand:- start:148 stop:654 length:507 start_codon:yes stop_codon:yes gene_type:complete
MSTVIKKVFTKIVLLLRYFPFDLFIKIRSFIYRRIFKSSSGKFNILDSVVINHPQNVSIGNRVSIHQFCYFDAQSEIDIGDDVSIGCGVTMITSSHNFMKKDQAIKDQGVICKPIKINDNVWIGSNVTILQGVKIGKNTVIGANSLVNKDIPENVVAAGAPCKVIRER